MEEYALYRTYSKDGTLLYIGQSNSWPRRMKEHSRHSDWFEYVADVKIERHSSKSELDEAERQAIVVEKPIHNITHNSGQEILSGQWLTHSETVKTFCISARTLTRRLQSGEIDGAYKDKSGQWTIPADDMIQAGFNSIRTHEQQKSVYPKKTLTEIEKLQKEIAELAHQKVLLEIELNGVKECLQFTDNHLKDIRELIIPHYERIIKECVAALGRQKRFRS
jgi:predicted GIY-YIG superfamily endonuclease